MDSSSNIFRLVNLGVGGLMIFGGIAQFFGNIIVQSIILGCYVIIFGLTIALLEFQIPPQTARYASFLFSFVGRGAFYIFIGCILIEKAHTLRIIAGSLIGVVGAGYVALEFIPSVEPPENMRSSEWDGEQV